MRPRQLLRIARWEVTRPLGSLDRRTLLLGALAALALALVGPLVAVSGVGLDDGLYRIGVAADTQYHDVASSDDRFVVVEGATASDLRDGTVDLLASGQTVADAGTDKGAAAREAFRDAVERYNERQLGAEPNQTAAFPVDVTLEFQQQAGVGDLIGAETGDDATDGDTDDDGGGSDSTDDGSGDGTGDGSGDGTDDGTDDGPGGSDDTDDGASGPLGDIGAPLSGDAITGPPAEIDAPFPFQSLVLAFLFLIPLNFLIQVYGSTILSERLNRRGELLLVAPVTRVDIVAGKTLPYVLGALAIESVLAVVLVYLVQGSLGGLLSTVALTPLVLLFLGTTFLGAMFARSFKELTFVTVTITVSLTAYAFVPAIFTDVNEIALISPLTLVVRDLQAEAVTLSEVAFSLTPPLLVATVCFALGMGLYREEDMFTQRSIPGRVLDALAGPVTGRWQAGVVTAALIPFVFLAQLFAIALFFPLGAVGSVAVVLVLVVVVVTEEIGKSLHIYAAHEQGRFDSRLRTGFVLGLASGVGFFVAEKIALLAQLVGLPELAVGEAGLLGGVTAGPVLLVFLLFPLTLHVLTATISAVGAGRGRQTYAAAVTLAMAVHLAYNLTVVVLVV